MLDQIEELKKIQNLEIIDDIHLQYLRLISVLFLPAFKKWCRIWRQETMQKPLKLKPIAVEFCSSYQMLAVRTDSFQF